MNKFIFSGPVHNLIGSIFVGHHQRIEKSEREGIWLLAVFFHLASVSCASTRFHAKIMIIERLDTTSQLQNVVSELDANMLWELARTL